MRQERRHGRDRHRTREGVVFGTKRTHRGRFQGDNRRRIRKRFLHRLMGGRGRDFGGGHTQRRRRTRNIHIRFADAALHRIPYGRHRGAHLPRILPGIRHRRAGSFRPRAHAGRKRIQQLVRRHGIRDDRCRHLRSGRRARRSRTDIQSQAPYGNRGGTPDHIRRGGIGTGQGHNAHLRLRTCFGIGPDIRRVNGDRTPHRRTVETRDCALRRIFHRYGFGSKGILQYSGG